MVRLNEENLNYSMLDYLNMQDYNDPMRSVGLITNKQFVFYVQKNTSEKVGHNLIMELLLEKIHPEFQKMPSKLFEMCEEYVTIAGIGQDIFIYTPDSGILNEEQYNIIEYNLKQVEEYNCDKEDLKKISIYVSGHTPDEIYYHTDSTNTNEILEYLKNRISNKEKKQYEETIVGIPFELMEKENISNNVLK